MRYLLIVALLMSGCVSMPEITPEQAAMSRSETASKSECYRSQAAINSSMWGSLSAVPQEQRAMALMMLSQNAATRQLVAIATGRSADPCSEGTNFHDVEVAYLKAQGQVISKYTDLAKWGVGMGLGYLAVESITSSLADAATGVTIAATDNAKINYQSQNKDAFQQAGNDLTTSGDNNLVNNNDDCIDCDQDETDTGDGGVVNPVGVDPGEWISIDACISNPPGGYNSHGTPMWTQSLSCKSYWQSLPQPIPEPY